MDLIEFWKDKCGKHSDIMSSHEMILKKDLIVDLDDFINQVNKNTFKFGNFGEILLVDFLKLTELDHIVKPEYVKDCMRVTSPRPAIGKGEFLLVSNFANIQFAKESGDLIDKDNKKRIEVKGMNSTLSGDGKFKQMNKGIIYSIYRLFETSSEFTYFGPECAKDLETRLSKNKHLIPKVIELLQNYKIESNALVKETTKLYEEKGKDLLKCITAMQLYSYLKIQKATDLVVFGENKFVGFSAPNNLYESLNIVSHFEIKGWELGKNGISIVLK